MGRRGTIERSMCDEDIRDFLVSGWSPRAIREYLTGRHGESKDIPSPYSLGRYSKTLAGSDISPAIRLGQGVREACPGPVEWGGLDGRDLKLRIHSPGA